MTKWLIVVVLVAVLVGTGFVLSHDMMGSGAFKRMVTLSGIYAICKPQNYPVVCFLDADSRDGGMFCMPLSQVGGDCK